MTKQAMMRRNMVQIMEAYLEAMIEKKPEQLPLAAGCRATYNGAELTPGDSELWRNTLVIRQRQTFIDPISGQMVFFGVATNETIEGKYLFPVDSKLYAKTYMAAIRLKLDEGKISEIEEVAVDQRLCNFYGTPADVHFPDLAFDIPEPEEERSSREELIELVETYWDCVAKKQPPEAVRVHPDAQRFENGYQTTNHTHSFRGDFKHNPGFFWDTPQAARSYPVVDPIRGVVVNFAMLESEAHRAAGYRGSRIVEAFKIRDGALYRLMAFFPLMSGPCGWEK